MGAPGSEQGRPAEPPGGPCIFLQKTLDTDKTGFYRQR